MRRISTNVRDPFRRSLNDMVELKNTTISFTDEKYKKSEICLYPCRLA